MAPTQAGPSHSRDNSDDAIESQWTMAEKDAASIGRAVEFYDIEKPYTLRMSRTSSRDGVALTVSGPVPRPSPTRYQSSQKSLMMARRLSDPSDLKELVTSPGPQRAVTGVYQKSALANVQAVVYDEPQDPAIEHAGRLWTPWALRFTTILALMVFFMISIAMLEVLDVLAKRDGGFGQWTEDQRYLWNYVPPVLFFSVAAVWNQVDYRTKQSMPWRTMVAISADASHSVLLNYISPLNAVAFFKSLRLGHPGVAVTILGTFTIRVLIVVSTAVLALESGSIHVSNIPLRIMEALLGLMVILSAAMIIMRPVPATSCDTSTIAGLASVLSNSHGYNSIVKGLSLAPNEQLNQELAKQRYQTVVGAKDDEPFFRISIVSKDDEGSVELLRGGELDLRPKSWWSPLHDATRFLIMAVIFGAIIAVELLHQRSKKNNGLMNVVASDPVLLAWQFVPAAIAMILFVLVSMVDFSCRVIQPYLTLKRGATAAQRSIQVNYLACMAPEAMMKALKNGHIGVVFSAMAVLIAPVLLLVTSGLYFGDPRALQVGTPASGQDGAATTTFATGTLPAIPTATATTTPSAVPEFLVANVIDPNIDTQTPDFAAAANAIVQNGDAASPPWTSGDLVFPALEDNTAASGASQPLRVVNTRVTAAYATMNCTPIAAADLKIWVTPMNQTSQSVIPHIAIPVDTGCGAPCRQAEGVDTCDGKSYAYVEFANPAGGALFGQVIPTKSNPTPVGWSDSCPQLSLAYGTSSADGLNVENVVAMNCYPAIMQAAADGSFKMPDGTVILAAPDRGNALRAVNGARATLDLNTVMTIASTDPAAQFDATFAALTTGPDGVVLRNVLGESNVDQVRTGLERLYGKVMAQRLNLGSRIPEANMSPQLEAVMAALQAEPTLRLVQDTISTRVVEGLLGAIFLLLALASVFADSRKVLPYDPCSIARMSSLIADSELVEDIMPAGSEFVTSKQINKASVFDLYSFSMGIFNKRRGEDRHFGIDTGRAEELEGWS